MEEKSAFDLLVEHLIELGYSPETNNSNKIFIIPGRDRMLNTKFVVCKITENIFFFASDSFGTRAYSSSTFTGLYSSIKIPEDVNYKIVKKDWFDLFYRKRKKTGVGYIDRDLTIISSTQISHRELSRDNVELFLKINRGEPRYSLVVENDYCPKIEELKDRKVIGLETNKWIFEKEDLEQLIDIGGKLIQNMKSLTRL